MGVDEALRLHDLAVDDLILIVNAIGTVHDEPPNAAWSHVHLGNRGRKPFRPPPLPYVVWICPQLEHDLSRRVEDARGDDLALPCLCRDVTAGGAGGHVFSPWF